MKTYGGDIVCMAFKSLDTTFSLIVPDLFHSLATPNSDSLYLN